MSLQLLSKNFVPSSLFFDAFRHITLPVPILDQGTVRVFRFIFLQSIPIIISLLRNHIRYFY